MNYDILNKWIDTQTVIYESLGVCIYCGSGNHLTDEHIIPRSLNGSWIFRGASCDSCSKITSRFENNITREVLGTKSMYGVLRRKLEYKTRQKKKDRISHLPLSYLTPDGIAHTINLPIDIYPLSYISVYLPRPGILTGVPLADKNPSGINLAVKISRDEQEKLFNYIERDDIQIIHKGVFPYGDFYRLLAKIAHGIVVASCGLDGYESYLPALILGKSPYLSHYIGGYGNSNDFHMLANYAEIRLHPIGDKIYLLVHIHILGGVPSPDYQVIAGQITDPARVGCISAT